jgi:hypothetical protein
MFRTLLVAAAIATLPVLSPCVLLGQQTPPPAAGGQHPPMMMPKPVNLKVLPKDTSPQNVMKIMLSYSQQLGVRCGFCHATDAATKHPNFASDEKPEKNTARTMILMTNEINAKYLAQIHDPDAAPDQKTVSCGTCHKGHSMPVTFKPSSEHSDTDHPGMEHPATPPKP